METPGLTGSPLLDLGFLIARVLVGLLMAAHGSQKLFGWFGGQGLEAAGKFMKQLGFQPARLFATAAALGELVSGLLIAVGLFGPVGPALMLAVMIVAAISVHWPNGLFAKNDGIELPLLYSIAAIRFALTGPGRYSLDAAVGFEWASAPAAIWIAIVGGVLGGVVNLALRRPARPAT